MTEEHERIPFLTREGFVAALGRGPRGKRSEAHHTIAEANRFVDEESMTLDSDAVDEEHHVVSVEYTGRFHYRWIAVDFGHASQELRDELRTVLGRTSASRGGLLLSDQDYASLPDHVHTPSSTMGTGTFSTDAWYLAQFGRFVLRALGPTRVLFLDVADAALFSDALSGQTTAIVCASALPASESPPRSTRVDAPRHGLQVLEWLIAASPSARLSEFRDDPRFPRRANEALHSARVFMLPTAAPTSLAELRRLNPSAGLLPASPKALASHLVPNTGEATASPEASDEGVVRITTRDLGRRDRERASKRAAFACLHLLGDSIAATPIVHAWRKRNPEAHVTLVLPDAPYARVMELCPDVDRLVYVTLGHEQLVYGGSTEYLHEHPAFSGDFDERFVLDIQRVARDPRARGLHMTEGYARLAEIEITSRRPSIAPELARAHRPDLGLGARYAVLARHTVSGGPPEHRTKRTKRWPEDRWPELARRLRRELGLEVVSIGTPSERRLESPHALDLHGLSILEVAALLADAALLVTIDNGIYHLGQGLGTPTVHLVPDWFGTQWVACDPDGPHVDLSADLQRLPVRRVLETAAKLCRAPGVAVPRAVDPPSDA
ncbi:MAG: hypothetical protein HZA53_16855 [Planctomycetes bacterium]|nr:hypothetical protein [Planctomycetota bacterium]